MMVPGWVELALEVTVVTSTLSVLLFTVQWTLTSPWWHDPVGRTVMVKDAGLLVLLIPNCVSIFFRHVVPVDVIVGTDLASLVIVTLAMIWRSVVWFRIKRPQSPRALWRIYQDIRQSRYQLRADKDS